MDIHKLIEEVRQRPALWDARHPEHANRQETQRQWLSVSDAIGAQVELCRNKWKNLRCSYRRQLNRRQSAQQQQQVKPSPSPSPSPSHQWPYAEAMSFLDGIRLRKDSSNNEEDDSQQSMNESMFPKTEQSMNESMFLKSELLIPDEMEADNEALMQQFQIMATPQAIRRLSHSISLASAAAEEQSAPTVPVPMPMPMPIPMVTNAKEEQQQAVSAMDAAAASSCQCAKRVDEQVNFLENLEREEQQLMQSTSQDLARCKNILHVGDSDYNFLISFLPMMKQMSPLQNVAFRAKMGELLLHTMQQSQMQQQQLKREQLQPSQMLLNQQQMALDQAQQQHVSTSSTNWN